MNSETFENIAETASEIVAPRPRVETVEGVPVYFIPPGWTEQENEHLLDEPRMIRERKMFTESASFVEYVKRFEDPLGSIIEVRMTDKEFSAEAILDYHQGSKDGQRRWGFHQAIFDTKRTPEWEAWSKANGREFRQADFADFLYQNQAEIVSPMGSVLLETIQTLSATAKGEFRDFRDPHTGTVELIYSLKVGAQGGTRDEPLELPKQFTISVAPFFGCDRIHIKADLQIKTPKHEGEPVMLGFKLYRPENQLRELFSSMAEKLREETELPVFMC